MSLLKALAVQETMEQDRDSLGGASTFASGAYPMTVALAYIQKSSSGSLGLFLQLKAADGQVFKTTQYMTGGDAKGNKPFYTKDGKNHFLPGYLIANALTLLTVGKEISDIDTEPKVIKLYNSVAKAEVPTTVDVLTELLGAEIIVGLVKQTVDKTKKNENTGGYEPTGEVHDVNEIDKLFRAKDFMTKAEISAQATSPDFYTAWVEKNKDVTRVKTGKSGSGTGTAGAPAAAGTAKPKVSLFG